MEDGTVVKFPIWSGDFLSKIDLSGVSFENVVWNLSCLKGYFEKYHIESSYDINYSETNAAIDFSKAYKIVGIKLLYSCNFSGTDLSQNEINGDIYGQNIGCCVFSNTGIRVKCDFSKLVNENLMEDIRNRVFDNCYLNDTLLSCGKSKDILKEYTDMIQKYNNNVLEAIEKAKNK